MILRITLILLLLVTNSLLLHCLSGHQTDATVLKSNSNISYFAICLIIKNDQDIVEWIEYHKRMGCSKFYVFDHSSQPPLNSTISSYIESGLVDYSYIEGIFKPNPQIKVYRDCIDKYRENHTFMVKD